VGTKLAWRALCVCTVAATATIGLVGTPAQAATTNVWRTEYYNSGTSGQMNGVVAYSKGDGWAIGNTYKDGNFVYGLDVLHWNGGHWSSVSIPDSSGYAANSISGEDGVDVWVLATNAAGDWTAFRFDGSHWHTIAIPAGVGVNDLVVLSATNAWTTSGSSCTETNGKLTDCTTSLWHWNGSTWQSYTIDADITSLAGTSAGNLRAAGATGETSLGGTGTLIEYQWSGSAWVKKSIPAVKVQSDEVTVATDGTNDVWLSSWTAGAGTVTALHWNGKAWSTIKSPTSMSATPGLVPDGSGGAWFGALAHWTGKAWVNAIPPISSATAASIFAMAKIPGTSGSYWGAAQVSKGSSTIDHPTVMIYGPLP
jgi:hypothetical protein